MKMYPNGYPYVAMMMLGLSEEDRSSTLAANIKELRLSNHLTQKAFAEKVQAYSIPRGSRFGGRHGNVLVSQYERQVCSPKIDNLVSICKAFDVNPLWLCGYDTAERMVIFPDKKDECAHTYSIRRGITSGKKVA